MQQTPIKPISHDAFFRMHFGDIHLARTFLEVTLSEQVLQCLDLTQMERVDTSYVDDRYRKQHSDVVFQAGLTGAIKSSALITFLFEHKSRQPKHIHVQLLSYILRVWEENEKSKKPLSFVLPIVVYHGTTNWKMKPMQTYFAGLSNHLIPFLPQFQYLITDLSSTTTEELEQIPAKNYLKNVLAALKFAKQWQVDDRIYRLLTIGASGQMMDEKVQLILMYLFSVLDATKKNEIELYIQKTTKKMPTIFQVMRAEAIAEGKAEGQQLGRVEGKELGRAEGRAEGQELGRAEGRAEAVKVFIINLISKYPAFSNEEIAVIAGVSPEYIQQFREKIG